MPEFKKTTAKTLIRDLKRFVAWLEEDEGADHDYAPYAEEFNAWMDILLNEDAFGTEGQMDPRGDHRD